MQFNGKPLDNERTVSSYGLLRGEITAIRCAAVVRGGMPASEASSGHTVDEFYYNPEEDYLTDFTHDADDIDQDLVSDDEFLWDYRHVR